jgi:hypothetical protein
MSYRYETERPRIFTPDGADMLLKIRDNVRRLLDEAGAFAAGRAWRGVTGDTWVMLACLDYLVERGEIRPLNAADEMAQNVVYTGARR